MDKGNEKRHNFFTEMALSSEGGDSVLCQLKIFLFWGPDIRQVLQLPTSGWGRGEQLDEREPDTSRWVPASAGLRRCYNASLSCPDLCGHAAFALNAKTL